MYQSAAAYRCQCQIIHHPDDSPLDAEIVM